MFVETNIIIKIEFQDISKPLHRHKTSRYWIQPRQLVLRPMSDSVPNPIMPS